MPVVTLTYLSYAGSNGNVQADSATQKFPLRRQNFLSCSLHSQRVRLLGCCCSFCCWQRDRDGVGLGPDRLSAAKVETVHGGLQMAAIHLDEQVVVVNLFALERVGSGTLKRGRHEPQTWWTRDPGRKAS